MSGKFFSFPFKVGYWLICLALIAALTGCGPKIPASMSDEDLQTCDSTAAEIREQFSFPISPYEAQYMPYMNTPGVADITSPLTGSILPFSAVKISFTQPPADPNVSVRILKVYVTPIDSMDLSEVFNPMLMPFGAIPSTNQFSIDSSWTPGSSGKFIVLVVTRNLKKGGNPAGIPKIDFGPASVAHVCVQIEVPKAGDVVQGSPQVVNILPLQDYTKPAPTITKTLTWTPTVTATFTPTFTATFTFTPFIPTFTATKPPTRIPPTDIPPTDPPAINCARLGEQECKDHDDVCKWTASPIAAPYCEAK